MTKSIDQYCVSYVHLLVYFINRGILLLHPPTVLLDAMGPCCQIVGLSYGK